MNNTTKQLLKTSTVSLLMLLLDYCGEESTNENLEYINNNFFYHMAGQLFLSYTEPTNKGHLNDEQVNLVKKCISEKWDGTLEELNRLMKL